MSFANDLAKFARKTNVDMAKVKRGVALKLFAAIVLDTPVGTSDPKRNYVGGRLRANWQVGRNTDPRSQLGRVDHTGAVVFAEIETVVRTSRLEDTLFFVNNLPYGPRVEYDGWSHTKAPKGMVRKNIKRFSRLLRQEVRRLS